MTMTEQRESPGYYETESRIGGREAYETAKAARKTELDYRQWVQVRTPEFKAWFGDWQNGAVSRNLLDGNGEPKVFYPAPAPDHITVTRQVVRTEQQQRRIREEQTRYVKYDTQGRVLAVSSVPKDGLDAETHTRTRTVSVPVEKSEAVTETLRFAAHENLRTFTVHTADNQTVGYLSLWRERAGEPPFLSNRPVSKPDGSYLVPYKAELAEGYRGLGIAAVLYRFAERQTGELIYPARSQTDMAKRFWDKRRREGGFSGYFVNGAGQIKSATDNSGLFSPDNPYADDSPYRPSEVRRPSFLENTMTDNTSRPPEDSPHGGLKLAKHHYQMQGATLTAAEKQQRAVLEHALEKTIAGLPPDIQNQARTHFYRSQVRAVAERHAEVSQSPDASPER
ncbi:hypothetical protein [Neisseria sp.]|uniref:hypothetical protein n=1 Tax=Neisseria sp. TaxID=192066 RepID=UPI0035A03A6F